MRAAGFVTTQLDGLKNDLTVYVGGRPVSVESKKDRRSLKTGNIAVEYENPKTGKATGLLSTTAQLWAFVLDDESVWIVTVRQLRQYFLMNAGVRNVVGAGDGNASVRLFKNEAVLGPLLTRLDNLSRPECSLTVRDVVANISLGDKSK